MKYIHVYIYGVLHSAWHIVGSQKIHPFALYICKIPFLYINIVYVKKLVIILVLRPCLLDYIEIINAIKNDMLSNDVTCISKKLKVLFAQIILTFQ